jgi:hypothetical protein
MYRSLLGHLQLTDLFGGAVPAPIMPDEYV